LYQNTTTWWINSSASFSEVPDSCIGQQTISVLNELLPHCGANHDRALSDVYAFLRHAYCKLLSLPTFPHADSNARTSNDHRRRCVQRVEGKRI